MGTPTPNKGYTLPTVNGDAGVWGGELNGNFTILDTNLGGVVTVSVAGNSNVTLSASQAQNFAIILTGTLTGNIDLIVPEIGSFYILTNETLSFSTITVTTGALGSASIVLPVSATTTTSAVVYCDGTNVVNATNAIATTGGLIVQNAQLNFGDTSEAIYYDGTELKIVAGAAMQITAGTVGAGAVLISGTATLSPGGTYGFLKNTGAGTTSGAISGVSLNVATAAVIQGSVFALSDRRLKTDIAAIMPEDGERFVRSAKPVTFLKEGLPQSGFVAQDLLRAGYADIVSAMPREGMLEVIDPDGLVSPADAVLIVKYDDTIAYLTAALDSALSRIDALEKRG